MKKIKQIYRNRYGDELLFTYNQKHKTVKMEGYNPDWVRIGYVNIYDEAYKVYCGDVTDPLPLNLFIKSLFNNNDFIKYTKYVYSDFTKYSMVDPSGGPYIALNTNLKMFFDDINENLIVKNITSSKHKIIFDVDNE